MGTRTISQTINLQTPDQSEKYISADSSGLMIYDGREGAQTPSSPSSTTNNVYIDENSLDVRRGSEVLATFGANGAVIGETSGTYAKVTSTALALIDSRGNKYLEIKDWIDKDGYAVAEFVGDGTEQYFSCGISILDYEDFIVTVDGVEVTSGVYIVSVDPTVLQFLTPPASGAEIVLRYIPYDPNGEGYKDFAFGTRSGFTEQDFGVTIGKNLILGDNDQTVIGKYNDDRSLRAFIIGNGTSSNARSNAFVVDWNGRVECGNYSGVFQSIFDIFYPVGSYYETSDANFNPNTAWGGTWVKDSAGRVTVAQNTNETEFDVVGETGGSKYMQNHAHSFTQPTVTATQQDVNISGGNHSHNAFKAIASKLGSGTTGARIYGQGNTTSGTTTYTTSYETHSHTLPTHTHTLNNGAVNGVQTTSHGTMSTGSSGNLQPYVVVIRWHRTA